MAETTCRILIVDDTESDRLATRFLLESKRNPTYIIEEIDQGKLAITACERFQPDCVLLDFRMPDSDGLEVLTDLRTRFGPSKFAIVLLTGSGHELLGVRALKSGAQDYIPKRYLTEELLERAIQNGLDKLALERQRIEAEDALAASERKLRNIIDTAPCALYTIDLIEGRPMYVSASAESLIGCSAEDMDQMSGAGMLALIDQQDRAAVRAHIARLRLAKDEETLECEFRVKRKDDSWRWISIRDRVVARDARGLGSVVTGAASDITHRRQIEDELRDSRAQLLVAQEAAGIGTWALQPDSGKFACSALFLTLYGRSGESAKAPQVWDEWIHPEDRARVSAEVARGLEGNPFETEFRVVWPDGSVHWLYSQGNLAGEGERATRFLGASLDVTAKKKAEEEMRRSNEDLERFAYVASHDLQEPLRTILSFSELFARRNKNVDQESRQFLDYVRQGGQRMQALISDLLTFSRVTQVDQEPLEEVDCNEVLEEALSGLRALITETGAVLIKDRLPVLTANFQQLTQLFQNLVGNAIKYRSERTPALTISAARIDRGWRFCVSDNGIGFDMVYAERIFEAFKRLHSRDQFSGSGIGLAICQRIVERHGGRIWAQSELGVGSSFFFTISTSD